MQWSCIHYCKLKWDASRQYWWLCPSLEWEKERCCWKSQVLGPEFTPFYSTRFHPISLFLSLFCRWILIFSIQMSMHISGINHSLLFCFMLGFTYNHVFYLLLWWYVHDLKEVFQITKWLRCNILPYSGMAQLQQLIITPKLMSLSVNYLLNDLVNINGKGISEALSRMQLKLPKSIPHSTEHVSLCNNLK